jgi:hypothetical protein
MPVTTTQILDDVIALTSRQDRRTLALSLLNTAVRELASRDFPKGILETTLNIASDDLSTSVSISALIRFRRFAYIRIAGTCVQLTKENAASMMGGGCLRQNAYWVAGDLLYYSLGQYAPALEVGYYTYPDVLTETAPANTNWYLDHFQSAITFRVCSSVFRLIGDDASANAYLAESMQSLKALEDGLLQE